jgi:hypothetical protein
VLPRFHQVVNDVNLTRRHDILSALNDYLLTIGSDLTEALHAGSKPEAERWALVERAMWKTHEAQSL